jgi:hypothetical protein
LRFRSIRNCARWLRNSALARRTANSCLAKRMQIRHSGAHVSG